MREIEAERERERLRNGVGTLVLRNYRESKSKSWNVM